MLLTTAGIVFTFGSGHAQVVKLWPGVAPGSEHWTQQERAVENTPLGTVVFNVTTPTLTAFLPNRRKATGTSGIIAPGGAFVALVIDLEGYNVARWLQENGIAAFVLKYRIIEKRQEGIALDPVVRFHDGLASAGYKSEVHIFSASLIRWLMGGSAS